MILYRLIRASLDEEQITHTNLLKYLRTNMIFRDNVFNTKFPTNVLTSFLKGGVNEMFLVRVYFRHWFKKRHR